MAKDGFHHDDRGGENVHFGFVYHEGIGSREWRIPYRTSDDGTTIILSDNIQWTDIAPPKRDLIAARDYLSRTFGIPCEFDLSKVR